MLNFVGSFFALIMAKFPQYNDLNLTQIAEDILQYWESNDIFSKSISSRKDCPNFVFYEGPPSANGMPGIHHVMARTIKDIFCRYKTQKGYKVERKAGWDTHGLPVELGVEKELGITKDAIGKSISVEQYNKECQKAVMRYTDVWNNLTKQIGFWLNTENPYITYQTKYIESVWWIIKQIHKKGLLYKSYTVQPYSPVAGSALSSHELNQPGTYKSVKDVSITAQFKSKESTLPESLKDKVPLYFLAWTTTPWTLPSNTALTVNPNIRYSIVLTYNQYTFKRIRVVIASDLIQKQFGKTYYEVDSLETFNQSKISKGKPIPYYLTQTIRGKDFVGIRYHKIWKETPNPHGGPENAYRIIDGNFVTTEEGSGIVHTAPTFGADDMKVAREATPQVPPMLVADQHGNLVPLVDLKGKFIDQIGSLSGKYVKNDYYPCEQRPEKSVDVEIAIKLKEENRAFKVEKYTHTYPHCWRTDKPVLYYPLDSWFVKMSDVRQRMTELNQQINWKPQATGKRRFGHWLSNASDWNLSRSRFWGIPLPIWSTEDRSFAIVIGSIEQLVKEIEKSVAKGFMCSNPLSDFKVGDFSRQNYEQIDLHKHIVDDIVLCSPEGKPMNRESDLIDVWFDSGSMPYAQWHYPFENKDKIDARTFFPADYIAEGIDQTRGWFYTLHAISTLISDNISFKNVISNGLVLDINGQKMAKRLGNSVDPFKILNTYGPDATRWYLISNANPWDDIKFDPEGINQIRKKLFHTLYNIYSFFGMYANIDGFTAEETLKDLNHLTELDRWILSELHTLIQKVGLFYDDYEPTKVARLITDFVLEKLSNWYVRLSRRKFWKAQYTEDKKAAYQVLYSCLINVAKLSAPIAPFYMERLYLDLASISNKGSESVHIDKFPECRTEWIDKDLEEKINLARNITSLALSLRKANQIKVRQPLQKLLIPINDSKQRSVIESIVDQIKNEINVKEVELIDGDHQILQKTVKPNFKNLGPKHGKNLSAIVRQIATLSSQKINQLEKFGWIDLSLDDNTVRLELSDVFVQFKDIEGWQIVQDNQITLSLDLRITDVLKNEGLARELVNRIQNIRKSNGLEVTDRIRIYLEPGTIVDRVVNQNYKYITGETLASELEFVIDLENPEQITLDDIELNIQIHKIAS